MEGEFPAGSHFRIFSDRCTISFPTHDAHVIIALCPIERFGEIKKRAADYLLDAYRETPDFANALVDASLIEKVIGSADIPTFVRRSSGPGWALVGDAAYHKDPTPAEGISDAFRGAEILADRLDEAFRGKKST